MALQFENNAYVRNKRSILLRYINTNTFTVDARTETMQHARLSTCSSKDGPGPWRWLSGLHRPQHTSTDPRPSLRDSVTCDSVLVCACRVLICASCADLCVVCCVLCDDPCSTTRGRASSCAVSRPTERLSPRRRCASVGAGHGSRRSDRAAVATIATIADAKASDVAAASGATASHRGRPGPGATTTSTAIR